MALIDKALDRLIGGPRKITKPIFVKDFSIENHQYLDLQALAGRVSDPDKKARISRDCMLLKQGIDGEKRVYFELKNCFLPLLCLHDIRLEFQGYSAQFDYVIISNRFICILETKMLNGDITIDRDGAFIRIFKNKYGKEVKREGMYSPVAQNERHIRILREILAKEKLVRTMPYHSLVVMANPSTILDKKRCPSNISKQIYRCDQIVPYLTAKQNDQSNEKNVLERYLWDIANYLNDNHKPIAYDYMAKYDLNGCSADNALHFAVPEADAAFKAANLENLYAKLKEYRLLRSRAENIKPYWVFTNEELEALVIHRPRTAQDLYKIRGFGQKKVEKYGSGILQIINEA